MVRFEVVGSGPRTVVWGHGLTSSRAQEDQLGWIDWATIASVARLVRYDAPGHGESSPAESAPAESADDPDRYRWDVLAGDMLAVATEVGADRFVAAGVSMGAATALHAALAAPGRVEALVLVLPPTAWEGRGVQGQLYEAGAQIIEQHGLATFIELAKTVPPPAVFADEPGRWDVTPRVAEALLPTVLRGAARSDLPPVAELAARVTQPALVLAWPGDPVHPLAIAETLAGALPDATLHVASSPAELAEWAGIVRDFVARLG